MPATEEIDTQEMLVFPYSLIFALLARDGDEEISNSAYLSTDANPVISAEAVKLEIARFVTIPLEFTELSATKDAIARLTTIP